MNQWYAFDPLANSSDVHESYYHWSNLHVGAEIDVYSRKIILSGWDEFTKQYYSDYGLSRLQKCNNIILMVLDSWYVIVIKTTFRLLLTLQK